MGRTRGGCACAPPAQRAPVRRAEPRGAHIAELRARPRRTRRPLELALAPAASAPRRSPAATRPCVMARRPRSTWWHCRRPSAAAASPRAARRATAAATATASARSRTRKDRRRASRCPRATTGRRGRAPRLQRRTVFHGAAAARAVGRARRAVAAEVQPHIDPITEIVAVIDATWSATTSPSTRSTARRCALRHDRAARRLRRHPRPLHRRPLVRRPRRRRPPVLRRSQLSPQQRTRGMLGGGNPRR